MADNYLDWLLYVKRQPLTKEWLVTILRTLWEHGIEFTAPMKRALPGGSATWEQALSASAEASTAQSTAQTASLDALIDRAAQDGAISLVAWDRDLEMALQLDPDPHGTDDLFPEQGSHPVYGMAKLTLGPPFAQYRYHPKPLPDPSLVTPPEQVITAYLSWAQLICTVLAPDFAFARHRSSDAIAEDETYWYAQDVTIPNAVAAGQIPDLAPVLARGPWMLYANAALVTPSVLNQWWEQEGNTVTRLLTGGSFLYRPLPPYEHRSGLGWYYFDQGEAAAVAGDQALAQHYYQRASMLFTASGEQTGQAIVYTRLHEDA